MTLLQNWLQDRPTKAEGPNQHVIGQVDPALIEAALREIGPSENWARVSRDRHPILNQGQSLILRDQHHRDTANRHRFHSVERIVAQVARLGLGTVPGKVLLANLPPGKITKAHRDSGEYYKFHNRIHVPFVTAQGVTMSVGDEDFHMSVGNIYLFQNLRRHAVRNDSNTHRIHLIIDMLDPRYSPAVYGRGAYLLAHNVFWFGSMYRKYGQLAAYRASARG